MPGAEITWSGDPLPFPPALEAVGFDRDVGAVPAHALADGVAATVAHFRRLRTDGLRPAASAGGARERARAATKNWAIRKPAATQSTASNEPVASRTAPSRNGEVAAIV